MSTVYRATDTVLGRQVAVKVLLAALAEGDPTYIARFQREARAAAALRHPAVVQVYDTGTDQGTHYIVMEYVAGRGLEDVIGERRLAAREAARVSAEVAQAVAAAHAAGILHRDIKPGNVMIRPDGSVKVLDFGIARTVQETTITQPAFAIGTAAYMPPERVEGRPGDERSDIYAIGCLLYALLTGRPPFIADEAVAILHQQVHADPVPPRRVGARVPPGLERLVLRMLAKDPAHRPQSAVEVASLLSMAAGGAAAEAGLPATAGRIRASVSDRRRTRNRRLPVAALLVAAATVLIVALTALGSGGPRRASASRASSARLAPMRVDADRAGSAASATHVNASDSPAVTATPPPGNVNSPGPVPPGHGGVPPGHGGTPPGHGGIPPGHGGIPPGQDGNSQGGDGGD